MERLQGRRGGMSRGRGHDGQGVSGRTNITNFNGSQESRSLHGTSRYHRADGKPYHQKSINSPIQTKRLKDDLDDILREGTLTQHIDPSFIELEDDVSWLKSQCIQLATLVLHLQNQVGSEQPKYKSFHAPAAIAIGRSLSPDFSNTNKIKATANAPQVEDSQNPAQSPAQNPAQNPTSIINPSSPNLSSDRVRPAKTPETSRIPKTSYTAVAAGSPMTVGMVSPSNTRLTPVLDRLLEEVQDAIQNRDGGRIALDLQVEPPLAQPYLDLSRELQKHYPLGKDQHLRTVCETVLPKGPDGVTNAWEIFASHLLQYLQFIRDYGTQNLLKDHNNIKKLLKWVRNRPIPAANPADSFSSISCICLGDSTFGVLILPSVVYLSKVLARFALGLDSRPELVVQLMKENHSGDDVGRTTKVTFVEDAANTIREAFIKCLSDKSGSSGFGRNTAPEGKRVGIYQTGNICLKLLFQCRKLSSATTMFVSIDAQSPVLAHYPASQRVTYLYYLGRYLFTNNHFFRAQVVLQASYDQCHAEALRHRQIILVYLIASNICLGRFPSSKLLQRREAGELAGHFVPLCRLIASGNLSGFREYLSLDNPHGRWLLRKRLLLQLRNRCEILVWRCLARRVFIEVGFPGGEDNKTPFLRLYLLQAAAQWLTKTRFRPGAQEIAPDAQRWPSPFGGSACMQRESDTGIHVLQTFDSEFVGIEDAIAETGFNVDSGTYNGPNTQETEQSRAEEIDAEHRKQGFHPTIEEVECIMASLIQQDLLCGFLTHNNPRFAIPGAKAKGALAVGFPRIWEVIEWRKRSGGVPGWVREEDRSNIFVGGSSGGLGGDERVVNLSGCRPVGVTGG